VLTLRSLRLGVKFSHAEAQRARKEFPASQIQDTAKKFKMPPTVAPMPA
jgi:hypothetical protein